MAFARLFRDYCQPLVSFAARYVRDAPVAENVVQDVFLAVWQGRSRLDDDLNIKTYLYTAVRNRALNHLRHNEVERANEEHLASASPRVETPEDHHRVNRLARAIHEAVESLPEMCRCIFSMNRFDRLTYAEIAEIQEISVKTVETQMARALKALRRQLAHLL